MLRIRFLALLASVVLTLFAFAARATDMVHFNDGRTLIGDVIKENDDEVEAKGTIAGVAIHSTFKKAMIAYIIRDVAVRTPSKVDQPEPAGDSKGDFLIVPIKGEFGKDVFPLGLINAMDWAVKNNVPRIVMVIDSPGGMVWAAKYMAEQMKERYDKLKFTMVIQNAISASIWPTFASDNILIAPTGTFGGAVVFQINVQGAAEVNSKMNSILAAEVATMAESKGHSGALVRAMMLPGQQVWAVPSGNSWKLVSSEPSDKTAKAVQLNAGDIFTLTSADCTKYGIARPIPGITEAAISHALGDLKSAGDKGEALMRAAKTSCEGLIKRYRQWEQNIQDKINKLMDVAATATDKEAVIRRIDDLASTVTNSIGTLKESAKSLHMAPLVAQMEAEDAAGFRKRIDEVKAKIRGK